MMAAEGTIARITGNTVGWKNILPDPFTGRVGEFTIKGIGHPDGSESAGKIRAMDTADAIEMHLQGLDKGGRKHGNAILHPFAIPDGDLPAIEIQILNPQAKAFHQAQSAAIEQAGHNLIIRRKDGKQFPDLIFGKDGGQSGRAPGADNPDGAFEILKKDLFIQEHQGIEGLVLGRGRHAQADGEMRKESIDFRDIHTGRMAFMVE